MSKKRSKTGERTGSGIRVTQAVLWAAIGIGLAALLAWPLGRWATGLILGSAGL